MKMARRTFCNRSVDNSSVGRTKVVDDLFAAAAFCTTDRKNEGAYVFRTKLPAARLALVKCRRWLVTIQSCTVVREDQTCVNAYDDPEAERNLLAHSHKTHVTDGKFRNAF